MDARILLVCGASGVGKTALIRRFVGAAWEGCSRPTVGLDSEAGAVELSLATPGLLEELRTLLPGDGLRLELLEIGGRDGARRGGPRGRSVDGLLLCYDLFDRGSFHHAAHLLLQHRMDRHLSQVAPRLPVVLCGTKVDEVDAGRPLAVDHSEAQAFARDNSVRHAMAASAKTGEFVTEAFHALAAAVLEAEEDAEAEGIVAAAGPTTSPAGWRPCGATLVAQPPRLVEVVDAQGVAFSIRPLPVCLERGLLHRAVHVWLCDARTGGLLLRRYAASSPKLPRQWGPTCQGEVLCHSPVEVAAVGPQPSEMSLLAAARVLEEQLGVEWPPSALEQWGSCHSSHRQCNELLDVFVASLRDGALPTLSLLNGEEVEWVHYLDIFGSDNPKGKLCHIERCYRLFMAQKMCKRILHADSESPIGGTGLAQGRLPVFS